MRTPLVVAFFALVFVAGVTLFFLYRDDSAGQAGDTRGGTQISTITPSTQRDAARIPPAGMREYRNATYHFSLFYPEELSVEESVEGVQSLTVTFQNIERGVGFQIFVVQYPEKQISEVRFKKDIPSGVRLGETSVTIDGTPGSAFYSKDAFLGETREVWFIHDSYLYEVTTLKPLEHFLDGIMQTWKFI